MSGIGIKINEAMFESFEAWKARDHEGTPAERGAYLDGWEQGRRFENEQRATVEADALRLRGEVEKLTNLYEWAKNGLIKIKDWDGNDYCMRDMARDELHDLDEYERTGKISI